MARSQRTKITPADLGAPALVKTLPVGQDTYFLGTLVGIVSGFVERSGLKDDQKFEGLRGMFRSIPSTPDRDELESGVLFIPDAFHNMIAAKLRAAQVKDPNAVLEFAFEVCSVRANNPAGYSWDYRPMQEDDGKNPIDELIKRAKLLEAPRTLKAIEDRNKKAVSAPPAKK